MAPLQDHSTDADTLVAHLQAAVGAERWRVWFDGATAFHLSPDGLTVGVANLFISDYLKSHFADHLDAAARQAVGRPVPITFRVQPDLFQRRRAKNLADEAEVLAHLGQTPRPAPAAAPAATRTLPQAPPLFTLDNFVVGPCNQMAYAAARCAVAQPGKDFHPLFIHGACGLGKTHLLQAVLHELRGRGTRRVACLSAEQFTNRYLTGMRTGGLDAFRHHFRTLDVLAIDDVHFLSGKQATQEEFLHTFNEFEGCGRLIILASDSHPREIQAVQDRLVSRWIAGLVVRLGMPDADTRRRLIEAKARHMGRPLPPDVVALLADRIPGSVRDLEGALTRLLAFAGLLHQPLTLDLARHALADAVTVSPARTSLPEIEEAVAQFFGVTAADIRSDRRSHCISLARQVTMVLGRELTGLSLSDIARMLGGKNHTTVLAACRKWQDLLKSTTPVSWMDRTTRRSMSAEALLDHLRERVRR